MSTVPTVQLKPVVRYREFPFGIATDPSMRHATAPGPWEFQDRVLDYLRSGVVVAIPMGGNVPDPFDRPNHANPVIDGRVVAGLREMTDGEWFWYAALIHMVEKYNVRLPEEFVRHAARNGWRVNPERVPPARYECSYFGPVPTEAHAVD
jgi:hypothetical protein